MIKDPDFHISKSVTLLAILLIPASAFAAGEGLDALNDDALLSELGSRGMTTLLNRAFEVNNIPQEARQGELALIAINQLNDPSSKLTPAQKRALVDQAVAGIQGALPSLNDPKALMKAATVLITESIEKDVNTLEYWGENPKMQSELRPVVQAVIQMLDKANTVATAAANVAANQIKSPDDKVAMARYEQLNNLALTAEYTKNLVNYDLVLSIDAADPQRKSIAKDTIAYLKQFDDPTQPVRAIVDVRMAKLYMLSGDYKAAHKLFALVAAAEPTDFPTKPEIAQQYEARYFDAVTDLLAQKPDEAQKRLDDLIAWQGANLPQDPASVKGANAAAAMLTYRIESLRSDLASDADEKKKYNEQAVATLEQLLKDQPGLQGIIFEQLMSKLPADASMGSLDPLLLEAMAHKGEEVTMKPAALTAQTKPIVERAVAAAKELMTRPGVEAEKSNMASLLLGFMLQKLGRLPEAANAFMDYAQKNASNPANQKDAQLALNNAEATVGSLRDDENQRDTPAAVQAYERLLPLAINPPFNHLYLAYEYAKRLVKQNHSIEAVKYFKLVPPDDKRILFAHYYETIALKGELDTLKADDPRRSDIVVQIQDLAKEVKEGAQAAIASAPADQRNSYRSMLAGTSLLAAELARTDQKQPQQALDLLNGFETQVKGLPDENQRLTDMLLIRVQSYMALNKTDLATAELVKLLNRNPAEGGRLVYGVLTSLDDQLSRAEAAGDEKQIRDIARNRAKLTGFLVEMARNSKEPAINKLAYGYAVFDAEVQRYAATQEPNEAAKKAGLEKALDLFKKLDTPQGLSQYQADVAARLEARKKEGTAEPTDSNGEPEAPPAYDPAVKLGLARTEFDLGDWKDARDGFSQLISEKKLGPPVRTVIQNGQEVDTDNDQYWEANYKLLRANFNLNNPEDVARSKTYLKSLYIRYGPDTGGKKWHAEFEKLRADVIPDFNPNNLAPATAPAK
jgi:tetratricopeptide (TPR) repeat protein